MYLMYLLQDFGMVRTLLHLLKCKERYGTPQIGKATTKFRHRFNNCKSKYGFQERKSKIPQKLFLSHYCHNCHLGNSSINLKNFIYHQVSMRKRSPYISILNIWVKVFKNGPSKICRRQPLKHLNYMVCLSTNFAWSILEYLESYDSHQIHFEKDFTTIQLNFSFLNF